MASTIQESLTNLQSAIDSRIQNERSFITQIIEQFQAIIRDLRNRREGVAQGQPVTEDDLARIIGSIEGQIVRLQSDSPVGTSEQITEAVGNVVTQAQLGGKRRRTKKRTKKY
jgi:hypothetical protein